MHIRSKFSSFEFLYCMLIFRPTQHERLCGLIDTNLVQKESLENDLRQFSKEKVFQFHFISIVFVVQFGLMH